MVRLIDESNAQVGVINRTEALNLAREAGLDLVEVAPTSDPPVCRIMDYGKWLYQQRRRLRESHKKSHHHASLKEIRLTPEIDQHDLNIKLNHSREFIGKGHKVQFTVVFRGRQMLHQDRGYEILNRTIESLADIAKVESPSKMAHRRLTLLLVPK
jgi:translation initiation factor IF-3